MTTIEESVIISCEKPEYSEYWQRINNVLIETLKCEIELVLYTSQKEVLLETNIGTISCQYYQDNPQEYHLWFVSIHTEKFSVKLRYDKVFQWQNKPEDHAKYENALLRVLELATPICIDSN